MRRQLAIRQSLAAVGFLLFVFALVAHCAGCGHAAMKAEVAAVSAVYGLQLDQCKAVGKASGSFAVYEACEKAETRKLCTEKPQLRTAWAACAEVGVLP